MGGTITVFMFHDVRDLSETDYPERYKLKSFLTKKQFESQIDYIDLHYTIIRSYDVFDIDINDGKHYAILTFDDGLLDHYYVAKYLFDKGISGTFLVPTRPILEHRLVHTHKLQFIQASIDDVVLVEDILSNFNDKGVIWDTYSATKWHNNWWSKEMIFITNILRKHQDKTFNNYEFTNHLFKKYVTEDEEKFAKDLYLNEGQLTVMADMGMVIGGHGDTSENLLLLDDVDADIKVSSEFIRDYSDIFMFSYPNGGFNDEIKEVMTKYCCELAFTVNPMTITNLDSVDYLEYPRYDAPQKVELK